MGIHGLVQLEDYDQFAGPKMIERIKNKVRALQHLHVAHINSTCSGGGVAELLNSLTLLMNNSGIKTGWRIIHGGPDFFSITKKMHNALQGGKINLSARKRLIYEEVIHENAVRNHLEHHNGDTLMALLNAHDKASEFVLPSQSQGRQWTVVLDSKEASPGTRVVQKDGGKAFTLEARSLAIISCEWRNTL